EESNFSSIRASGELNSVRNPAEYENAVWISTEYRFCDRCLCCYTKHRKSRKGAHYERSRYPERTSALASDGGSRAASGRHTGQLRSQRAGIHRQSVGRGSFGSRSCL